MTLLKAEIHCHIEGATPPSLARQKAAQYGVDISDLIAPDGESYAAADFSGFLAAYDRVVKLFRTPDDFADLSYAHYTSIARQGAIYGEVFLSPDQARSAGLSYGDYLAGLADGLARASAETGIIGRFIPCAVRQLGAEAAERAARQVVANPHPYVTGFGLAGDERVYRPSDFVKAFAIAGEAGLGLTAHAGEVCGADSVRAALDALPVRRIGHGVRAIEDPDLVRRIAGEGIVLEVCPGSNVALGVAPVLKSHPLPLLMAAGVRVTINSDDPPIFRTSLSHEYDSVAATFGLDAAAMRSFTRTAIEAAFIDQPTRNKLLSRLAGD
ncbi:MAG: adenosine deaminase [Hyphomicrobiales bacterium]|nr:adenosine deaminase [Hyphomicrobiales bacterium]